MSSILKTKHIKSIQRRIDYLREGVEDGTHASRELSALTWAIEQLENDERNITYRRAYNNGQLNMLKFYKKTLKKAAHSNNVTALQFLLDRTNEWIGVHESKCMSAEPRALIMHFEDSPAGQT